MYTKGQQSRAAHSQDSNHNFNRIAAWREGRKENERDRGHTTQSTRGEQAAEGSLIRLN